MQVNERPELGAKVSVKAEAHKVYDSDDTKRHWARREFEQVQDAVYIGYRFVYEGYWHFENMVDPDTGTEYTDWTPKFIRTGQMELWKVVTNPRHDPIYVYIEDVNKHDD